MAYGNQSQLGNTAAQYPIGTSGDTVPLNSGTNTWSGRQRITSGDTQSNTTLGISRLDLGTDGATDNRAITFEDADGGGPVSIIGSNGQLLFTLPFNIICAISSGGLVMNGFPLVAGGTLQINRDLRTAVNIVAANQVLLGTSVYNQEYTGSGGNTWTLPSPAGNSGLQFLITNDGTGAFDLNGTIRDGGADVTTVSVAADSSLLITCNGTRWRTHWYA